MSNGFSHAVYLFTNTNYMTVHYFCWVFSYRLQQSETFAQQYNYDRFSVFHVLTFLRYFFRSTHLQNKDKYD